MKAAMKTAAITTLFLCLGLAPGRSAAQEAAAAPERPSERLARGQASFRRGEYSEAATILEGVLEDSAQLKAPQRLDLYRYLAATRRRTVFDPNERGDAHALLSEALEELSGDEKATPRARLARLLQAAAASGMAGEPSAMEKRLDAIIEREKEIDAVKLVEALEDAALFYLVTREYDIVEALQSRRDSLYNAARVRHAYQCRFETPAPIGVGGWLQSAAYRDRARGDARFTPYPAGHEEMLRADMAAERGERAGAAAEMAGQYPTTFWMLYDEKGWHIFIESTDPRIEQIMLQGGKGGSSLEMFFAPGLEGETYYQWIIRLATGEVDIYSYNTPHRGYRHLEHRVGSFETETRALANGWGTVITIPWEALYDKLPFVEGNAATWRFAIMRWGPVRVTWSGKVHEPGRWGWIEWQPPPPAQRQAILQRLVQRAWWKFQATRDELSAFWQGARGDKDFWREVVEPVIGEQEQAGAGMEQIGQWNADRVDEVFSRRAPEWMEFGRLVENLRVSYLTGQMQKAE